MFKVNDYLIDNENAVTQVVEIFNRGFKVKFLDKMSGVYHVYPEHVVDYDIKLFYPSEYERLIYETIN